MTDSSDYKLVLPCVVCGDMNHEGYWDHNGEKLLYVDCPNRDRPDVKKRILEMRELEKEIR